MREGTGMTGKYVISQPAITSVKVSGRDERFPVRRVICVGRNYAAHAREMGKDPDREAPFFFLKPTDAVCDSGSTIPYPSLTKDFQHEIELVVAIGKRGSDVPNDAALGLVYGYGVGIDLTRRDLQLQARDAGRPWDWGKGFDLSAPMSEIYESSKIGHPKSGRIWLAVNGKIRQQQDISDLIWSVPEIIAIASQAMVLEPGDLIFTGTPAGVGPMNVGDHVTGGVDGLTQIEIKIGAKR